VEDAGDVDGGAVGGAEDFVLKGGLERGVLIWKGGRWRGRLLRWL
jgi:hypothetical protein